MRFQNRFSVCSAGATSVHEMDGAPLPGVSMLTSAERKTRIGAVVRVASGNFLEMYDFMVYGYYASAIAAAFFPAKDPVASLMAPLATFGPAFFLRPLSPPIPAPSTTHT